MGCLKLNIENPTLLRVLNGGKLEFTKKCVDTSRYAYNGMEKDPEIKGEGNSFTTEFRQYDPRLGRWLSLDPLMSMFPDMSPYVAFDNNPILYVDPYGLASSTGEGEKWQIYYTDKYYCKYHWAKSKSIVKNKSAYRFDATRGIKGNKEKLISLLKNNDIAYLRFKRATKKYT